MFKTDRFFNVSARAARRLATAVAGGLTLAALTTVGMQAQQLPPQAAPPAQVQVEGELEVLVEDRAQESRVHHFLKTDTGVLRLEFAGEPPGLQSGDRVRVRGRFRDAVTLELGSANDVQAMAIANPNTLGQQRTIVILVNFQDNPVTPYVASAAASVTFTTTSNFFLENSHNQTWLTGNVAGWFTLPLNSGSCDYNQIASAADQAATANGVNLSTYTRKVYAFPQMGACGWWGLGTVGGNPSRAWINGTYSLKVVAHELGHNLGDYHSRSKACDGASCSVSEYGDDADVMGNPSSGHMNAYQKERLGWLNYGDTPAIQGITQSGSYWIDAYAPINASSSAPKALKIVKDIDSAGKRTWYYVEARTKAGFDGDLVPGVILHTGAEANGREIYELDVLPTTSAVDWRLDAGQSFEDTGLGLRITTLWADSTGAMIDVLLAAAPCTTSSPSISASPSGTVTVNAGSPVTFNVGVSNSDASACSSSVFNIDSWVPSGWSWSSSPASLTLGPGASGNATVTITPPSTATGSSDIQIGAYRGSGPGASVVRTIQVSSGTSAPATVGVSLSVTETKAGFSLKAVVTADGKPASGAQVVFEVTDAGGGTRKFSATTNTSGVASTNFKPRGKDPKGTYTVEATATVASQTATASLSFIVK